MALYIENGIAVDALWESHIVTSEKLNSWTNGFHKEDISVCLSKVTNQDKWEVTFKKSTNNEVVFKFDPTLVLNKPAWSAGATSFENAYLALQEILGWFPSGATAPTALGTATEATQLNVLSTLTSLFNEQKIDFELKCVEDTNGDMFLLRVTADEPAGTYTFDYIDATGAVATPVGAVTFCSPNALLTSIFTELQTLNATDFATEATADAAATSIANLLAAFGLVDFSTETTLDALLTAFNAIDFSTETTLDALLTAFNAEDFATETTLAAQAADIEKLVGFAITEFDEIDLTYVASGNGVGEIATVVYSLATVPVATLTLTYDASNRITNVTKS